MEITTMRTSSAVAHVASVQDVEELDRLQDAERANPKTPGGRVRVLEAIDVQRGVLAWSLGSEGGEEKKAPPPPPVDLSPKEPWREDTWSGMPQFNCRSCGYQTLEQAAITQHIAAAHPEVWRPYLKQKREA